MAGTKTNERPGTRAELRHSIVSAYKVREVLDLIRGEHVGRAQEILKFCDRGAAPTVEKLLMSAVANAEHNDGMVAEELYVSACFADEGRTLKRWRARARGRFTRIRKRTCHVTIIVSRLPEDRLTRLRAKQAAEVGQRRARRVAGGRKAEAESAPARPRRGRGAAAEETPVDETPVVDDESPVVEPQVVEPEPEVPEPEVPEPEVPEPEVPEPEVPEPEVSGETDAQTTEKPDSSPEESAE